MAEVGIWSSSIGRAPVRNDTGAQYIDFGPLALEEGDYTVAMGYFEQALALETDTGNVLGQANALAGLGIVARQQGDYTDSRKYHERALCANSVAEE